MRKPRNRVVQVRRFGGADALEVIDAPLPTAGRGEVRVRVLASSVEYTDAVIRRHLYPWVLLRPPFVIGYDVVGEIDQLGKGVSGFHLTKFMAIDLDLLVRLLWVKSGRNGLPRAMSVLYRKQNSRFARDEACVSPHRSRPRLNFVVVPHGWRLLSELLKQMGFLQLFLPFRS